jgi:hypothetical protein
LADAAESGGGGGGDERSSATQAAYVRQRDVVDRRLPGPGWRHGVRRTRQEHGRHQAAEEEAVTAAKIKKNAVNTAKIKNEAVRAGRLANGAVITNKLADGAVTGAKVDESSLSTVPRADKANSATKADTATSATTATSAETAANLEKLYFAVVKSDGSLARGTPGATSEPSGENTYPPPGSQLVERLTGAAAAAERSWTSVKARLTRTPSL